MGTIKLNRQAKSAEVVEKSVADNCATVDEKQVKEVEKTIDEEVSELVKADGGFVEEIKELRTENETVYRRNDRTCRKIITATPTRYRDENGELKRIRNTLTDNGTEIVSGENSFKVKFNKDGHNSKIFDLQKGNKVLTLSSAGSCKARGHISGCTCELCAGKTNTVSATLEDGTEIQYESMTDRIKENIIIKKRQYSYEYNFTLNIGDLTVEEGKHNDLLLKDTETGKTEFIIPEPFMYDANKKYSDKVSYEVNVDGQEIEIKVVADADFINAEDRAFPVTIDPQIIVNSVNTSCYSIEYSNDIAGNKTNGVLEVSRFSSNRYVTSFVEFSKPTTTEILDALRESGVTGVLEDLIVIKKITLVVHCYEGAGNIIIGDTTENIDLNSNEDLYINGKDISIDITNNNEGKIAIKFAENDRGNVFFDVTGEHAPRIEVDYELNVPVQDDFARSTKPIIKEIELTDKAKGFLYLKDGGLSTTFESVIASDFAVPLSITHINKAGSGNSGYGMNWHLNLDKKLIIDKDKDTSENTKYLYTDELGDNYVLSEKYYYMEESNDVQKPSVKTLIKDKSQISVDILGNLTFKGYPVYKQYDCNGYTLIPKIDDFINSDIIEQRRDEQIQLEEYLAQVKPTLDSYVITDSEGIKVLTYIKTIEEKYNWLKDESNLQNSNDYYFMTMNDAFQLQSLNISLKQYANKLDDIDNPSKGDSLTEKQKILIYKQFSLVSQEIMYLKERVSDNLSQAKELFTTYMRKSKELELLKLQTPVNFLRDENGIISGFNDKGSLVFLSDAFENSVSIIHNSKNQITEVNDSNGKVLKFLYENGLLKSITDNRGREVNFKYEYKTDNTKNKLTLVTFPDGSKIEFEDKSEKLGTIKSSCFKTSISYVKGTSKIEQIKKMGVSPRKGTISVVNATYYSDGILLEEDGNKEEYRFFLSSEDSGSYINYNIFNSKIKQYKKYDNAHMGYDTSYTYETLSDSKKVTAITGYINGKQTTTIEEYDLFDVLINRIEDWQDISSTVKVKTETTYEYDYSGNLVKTTEAKFTDEGGSVSQDKKITKFSYNAANQLILTESYIDGKESSYGISYVENVYDEKGNGIKTIKWNSLDSSSKFYSESVRAENGQVVADKDETGEVSAEYEYVSGTNIVNSVKYANGSKLAYGRNPKNFELTSVTRSTNEGESNQTDIVYEDGLPIKVTSGDTVLEYEYDHKGRKTQVKINGSLQSEYDYEEKYDYDQETESGGYIRQRETLSDGTVTAIEKVYTLDEETGRMKAIETVKANNSVMLVKEYDSDGILTLINDYISGTKSYVYDDYDNVTQVKFVKNSATLLTENNTYNEYGELTQKALTGAVTQTYSYSYKNNAARDLDYITFGDYKFKPLSDVNGRNTGKEIYNGSNKLAAEYITYRKVGDHATNMPSTVWFGSGNNIKDSIKYKYDSCGNISEITANGHVVAKYSYDSLNRLVREDIKVIDSTFVYTYDQNGNIVERCEYDYTSKTGEELSELKCKHSSYDYDGDRLIIYKHYDEQGNLVTDNFAYNTLGNPTTYRNKSVTWQYGKYLTQLGNTTFAYDGLGRRISKSGISFTYDSDGRLIKQSNGLEFVYDDKGVAGVKYANNTYFYRKDAQGNIIAILDSNGNVVVNYVYDAWGNYGVLGLNRVNGVESFQDLLDKDTPAFDPEYSVFKELGLLNPFRYRGYYYDTETELYYLQTRYYDPEIGRFISRDSIEYADPETINGLNLYAYCGNNPVMNVDPTGHSFLVFLIAALIGFTVSFASSAVSQAVFNGGEVNWGVAAVDGLFGAISAALWMVPGLGPVATGLINAGLTAVNGIITTGMENNWQYTLQDVFSIAFSLVVSGFASGMTRYQFLENGGRRLLTDTHKFVGTVGKRIVTGFYNNGVDIFSKSFKSAAGQLVRDLVKLNFGKGFYKDWLITGLQSIFSITFSKGLYGLKW